MDKAKGIVDDKYISSVKDAVEKMDQTVQKLGELKEQKKMMDILAIATPLQQAMRMLAHAWMHLWSLSIVIPKLKTIVGDIEGEEIVDKVKENSEAAFYYGKLLSDRFYLGCELKHFSGYLDYITSNETAVGKSFEEIFTGALIQ
jgi:hypothetical protein